MITQESLMRELDYDSETGVFYWKTSRGKAVAGKPAGTAHALGYNMIRIFGTRYYAHRLAWLYMTGGWPSCVIDHINGIPGDDRWENLRDASYGGNTHNQGRRYNNTSGIKGVSWSKARGKWLAQICHRGKSRNLGRYKSKDDAENAVTQERIRLHGEFANHG